VATFVIARSARVGAGRLIYPSGTEGGAASRDVVDLADPGRNGTRATAPLTAQEVLEADDKMRIAPVEPAAMAPRPLPPPHSTSNTLISSPHLHVHLIPTTSTATTKSVVDKKRRRHVYIGKWQKSWGRHPDPEDRGLGQGSGRDGRKRKRAIRARLSVGGKEPLSLSQNRAARKNSKKGRGRKKKGLEMEKNGQRQIASSLPPSRSSSIDARDEGGANQNAALHEEHDPDPDADADVDKGDWPGEYGHAHAYDDHIAAVPPGVTDFSGVVATPIAPEELERAIGAAFAAGMQYYGMQY